MRISDSRRHRVILASTSIAPGSECTCQTQAGSSVGYTIPVDEVMILNGYRTASIHATATFTTAPSNRNSRMVRNQRFIANAILNREARATEIPGVVLGYREPRRAAVVSSAYGHRIARISPVLNDRPLESIEPRLHRAVGDAKTAFLNAGKPPLRRLALKLDL